MHRRRAVVAHRDVRPFLEHFVDRMQLSRDHGGFVVSLDRFGNADCSFKPVKMIARFPKSAQCSAIAGAKVSARLAAYAPLSRRAVPIARLTPPRVWFCRKPTFDGAGGNGCKVPIPVIPGCRIESDYTTASVKLILIQEWPTSRRLPSLMPSDWRSGLSVSIRLATNTVVIPIQMRSIARITTPYRGCSRSSCFCAVTERTDTWSSEK